MPRLEGIFEYRFVNPKDVLPSDTVIRDGDPPGAWAAMIMAMEVNGNVVEAFAKRYAQLVDEAPSDRHRSWYRDAMRTDERTVLVRRDIT